MEHPQNVVAEVRTLDGELLEVGDHRLRNPPAMRLPDGFEPPVLEPLGEGPVEYGTFVGQSS